MGGEVSSPREDDGVCATRKEALSLVQVFTAAMSVEGAVEGEEDSGGELL